MYEEFFKLKLKPFELLPNPEFLFLSRSHKKALAYLDYGIRERAGFILLTGEVGSGKTTIMRNFMKKFSDTLVVANVFNTKVDSSQLIAMINDDFGLPMHGTTKTELLRVLNTFLLQEYVKGRSPVLVIDEAQNLTPEVLEEIRMLSNLETDQSKLLQIILVGQPELRTILASPELIQLRQRISINCHLKPLSRKETESYILHRLEVAGDRNAVTFTKETLNAIYRLTRGIPRLVNILCDFLLLSAFSEETTTIDVDMVNDIALDIDFEEHFWGQPEGDLPGATVKRMPGEASAPLAGPAVSGAIKDICQKIENIGRDTERRNQTLYNEMQAKMKTLEYAMKCYQMETIDKISKIRPDAASTPPPDETPAVSEKTEKLGFFRRFFGF